MSEHRKLDFDHQPSEIKGKIQNYWTKRAESFFELRHEEIESNKAARWLNEIKKYIPQDKKIKILDIGCGTAFFEIILGREGHEITGIDLTEEMVIKANQMISIYGLNTRKVKAIQMDAESLDFENNAFDMIVTRNLTWTLPHPIRAYQEWNRVLKSGGILLNFDAEYAKNANKNLYSPDNLAHQGVGNDMKDECYHIYQMLTISTLKRPLWDVEVLKTNGYADIEYDLDFGDRIYIERDQFYMLDKMFSIKAIKRSMGSLC